MKMKTKGKQKTIKEMEVLLRTEINGLKRKFLGKNGNGGHNVDCLLRGIEGENRETKALRRIRTQIRILKDDVKGNKLTPITLRRYQRKIESLEEFLEERAESLSLSIKRTTRE